MDDRDRRAPVALARDAPVAQAVRDLLFAEALRREVGGDRRRPRLRRRGRRTCPRSMQRPRALSAYHGCQRVGRERLAVDGDHLLDRQPVFLREREVALVVRGHAHHRAVAVAHQHVVADPHFDLLAGQRMRDEQARWACPSSPSSRGRLRSRCRACIPRRTRRARGLRFAACCARADARRATAQNVTPMIVSARVVNTYSLPSPIERAVRRRGCRAGTRSARPRSGRSSSPASPSRARASRASCRGSRAAPPRNR